MDLSKYLFFPPIRRRLKSHALNNLRLLPKVYLRGLHKIKNSSRRRATSQSIAAVLTASIRHQHGSFEIPFLSTYPPATKVAATSPKSTFVDSFPKTLKSPKGDFAVHCCGFNRQHTASAWILRNTLSFTLSAGD